MKDFTHDNYKLLIEALLRNNYEFITMENFFSENIDNSKRYILMRHDVDRRPKGSLEMSEIEESYAVKTTYYFRTILQTLKPNIIKKIANLGHEIGYHYESLAETNGDYKKAIKDFEKNLAILNTLYPIKSIAMHGRPTSKWDSRHLWEQYDYKQYGILSEPYFDIDFKKIFYITDAGRAWDNASINLRDKVDTPFKFPVSTTNDLIARLDNNELPNTIMMNIHPEHWAKTTIQWYKILILRTIKNNIKKILIHSRGK